VLRQHKHSSALYVAISVRICYVAVNKYKVRRAHICRWYRKLVAYRYVRVFNTMTHTLCRHSVHSTGPKVLFSACSVCYVRRTSVNVLICSMPIKERPLVASNHYNSCRERCCTRPKNNDRYEALVP